MQLTTITPNQKQSLELAISALQALKARHSSTVIVNRTIDNLNLILETTDND